MKRLEGPRDPEDRSLAQPEPAATSIVGRITPTRNWGRQRLDVPTPLTTVDCAEARIMASAKLGTKVLNDSAPRGAPPPQSLGQAVRLGSCELFFKLATGGMSTVYLAVHHGAHGFEKLVAVKRPLPRLSLNPDYVAMLVDEAAVSSTACHPCVREVFDLGVAKDGTPYLVMEFLAGEPLSRVCAAIYDRADLTQSLRHHRVVARIFAKYCHGIHAVHELSDRRTPLDVVHRDLSPQNLFALHDGTVRITDFGIMRARVRRQRPSGETVLKGKVAYMAPEYVERRPYDRRSDLWTLGVVLWELLTGLRLFRRENDADTFRAVLYEAIPPASALNANVDPRLDEIIGKALTRNVHERYASAHQMAQNLEAYLACNGGPVGSSDVSGWLRGILPDSLPMLTSIVESTRGHRVRPI
jgi:eukaryotic-like serine/threonine-protein kinase